MANDEPSIDDWILIIARQAHEQLSAPLSDDAALLIAMSEVTLATLFQKYALPHEQEKLLHTYLDQVDIAFHRLDETKRAIEKGGQVGDETLDNNICNHALRLYPEQWDNLEQVASYVLVLTAFTEWICEGPLDLDDTNGTAFIIEFAQLYNKEIERFFAEVGASSLSIN